MLHDLIIQKRALNNLSAPLPICTDMCALLVKPLKPLALKVMKEVQVPEVRLYHGTVKLKIMGSPFKMVLGSGK